jgi:hypothetical protein
MEKLETIVMADEVWSTITLEMTASETSKRECIQANGQRIVACVLAGRVSADDLRHCARWTSVLSREAVGAAEQSTLWSEEERSEALARQILHGSVSTALNKVRTDSRLMTERAKQSVRRHRNEAADMPGMGRMEKKDFEARRGFAGQA